MPFLAAVPAIAAGLGAAGAISGTTAAVIGGVGAAGSALYGASQGSKAASAAGRAADATQINIDRLNEQTKAIARQNALDSAELERQMTPEVPQLRTSANQAILGGIGPTSSETLARAKLTGGIDTPLYSAGGSAMSPLLAAAIEKAKSELALSGQLPQDVRNAVMRSSAANAAAVGGGGLGLGRDLSARDLGLTSLDLLRQRLAAATTLGQAEVGVNQFDKSFGLNVAGANENALLGRLQTLQGIDNAQFGRALSAGSYGQAIQQPVVGLDPSAVASPTKPTFRVRPRRISST
jgi:hypothetical protein